MADAILGADYPARKHTSTYIPVAKPTPVIERLVADPYVNLNSGYRVRLPFAHVALK